MTAAELVVGRRYLLGFGPVGARVFDTSGEFVRVVWIRPRVRGDAPERGYRFRITLGEFYTTINPERDVRELEE